MLREMHLASVLHKGVSLDAKTTGAHEALEMATIQGATALGLEDDIGSLVVGKKADLVIVNATGSWAAPWDQDVEEPGGIDPVTLVVGCASGRDVSHVIVNGNLLVEEGRLLCADEREVIEAARNSIKGIQQRSGVRNNGRSGWLYV